MGKMATLFSSSTHKFIVIYIIFYEISQQEFIVQNMCMKCSMYLAKVWSFYFKHFLKL